MTRHCVPFICFEMFPTQAATFCVNEDGTMCGWGFINWQVGVEEPRECFRKVEGEMFPLHLELMEFSFSSFTGDFYNTIGLDTNGNLWRAGNWPTPTSSLIPFEGAPSSIVHLSKCNSIYISIAVTTEEGDVWTFGKSINDGQYGYSGEKRDTFTRIPEIPLMRRTTCGHGFMVLEDLNGELYSCGKNDWGQLGLGDLESRETVTHIPRPKEMPTDPPTSIHASLMNIIITDSLGGVWTCGDNEHGTLGRDGDPTVLMKVEGIPPITCLDVGLHHIIGADEEGNVWTWGRNQFHTVTALEKKNVMKPLKYPISNISHVYCGGSHSFLETFNGVILGFGCNWNQQVKNSLNTSIIPTPVLIPGITPRALKKSKKKPLF